MRRSSRKLVLAIAGLTLVAANLRAEAPLLEVKHSGPVLAAAWSADGKMVGSAGEDGQVHVVSFPEGKEITRINAGKWGERNVDRGPVSGIVFSPDGKLLGVKLRQTDGPLKILDIATGNAPRKLSFPGYTCNHLAFTPDGQTLVASGPGEHMVWSHTRGSGYGSRMGNVPAGSVAAASPNGLIAAWCDPKGNLTLYFTDVRRQQRTLVPGPRALAFAPDAQTFALALEDKTIRLWALHGSEMRKFEGLREPATLLQFSANGKVLAAASPNDPVIRLWDVASARLRRRLTTNPVGVHALALSPDGRNLALTAGERLLVWSVATRELGELGPAVALSADEMRFAWDNLASSDQATAEAAFRKLASAGNHALDFLDQHIRAVAIPPIDWKRIDQLLLDLDSPTYSIRQKATVELSGYGELIQAPLLKYLATDLSPEAQRRATRLVDKLKDPALTPERLRSLEAIEILELMHTAQARKVLEELSRDSLVAQIRLAAREAVQRLRRAENKKKG